MPQNNHPASDPSRWAKLALAAITLIGTGVLLFARLGHYALWNDEADTALNALGICETGDTSAIVGHNLVAYANGSTLVNLRQRYLPPLPAYLTAPALGLLGQNAWAARFPFALCGLACAALIFWWLWMVQSGLRLWGLFGLALLGNVSFFLFCRQCRYYGLSMALSVALGYCYLHWQTRRHLVIASGLAFALVTTHYLIAAAVFACLALDYWLWGSNRRALAGCDWFVFLLPLGLCSSLVVWTWNPFATVYSQTLTASNSLVQRLELFWWNLRDLNAAEFGTGALLLLAPLLYLYAKDTWLLRGTTAVLVFVGVTAALWPQAVAKTTFADVRYLVPLIPLCILLGCRVLNHPRLPDWLAIVLALLCFETNLANFGPLTKTGFRSTLWSYVSELRSPPGDPYSAAAAWVREHVQPGQSVWVTPEEMTYPLMFHAPAAVYAWQLDPVANWTAAAATNARIARAFTQFKTLSSVHFKYEVPPDYVIAFGPWGANEVVERVKSWQRPTPITYSTKEILDQVWVPQHRPELFWHNFQAVTNFDRNAAGIFILAPTVTTGPPQP